MCVWLSQHQRFPCKLIPHSSVSKTVNFPQAASLQHCSSSLVIGGSFKQLYKLEHQRTGRKVNQYFPMIDFKSIFKLTIFLLVSLHQFFNNHLFHVAPTLFESSGDVETRPLASKRRLTVTPGHVGQTHQ